MRASCLVSIVVSSVVLVAATPALGQELTGEQVMRRVDRDHRSRDERGVVEMVLITSAAPGQEEERQARTMETFTRAGEGDDDMLLLRFTAPANIQGTALLTVEVTGRSDDQWLFLPALHRSRRIASSQRTQRFAGTDFTYEDLRTEDFSNWTYALRPDADVEGTACRVVDATPIDPERSGYTRRLIYVDRERFLVLKIEFFGRAADRPAKTLQNRDYQRVNGLWRASQSMMVDHSRNTRTLWRFRERQINPGLPASTFTVESLERGS